MSGHKRSIIQLSRQDLHRISSLNPTLRQVEQDYQAVGDTINHNRVQQLERINLDLEDRQKSFQNILGSFSQDLSILEQRNGQAILDQSDYFCKLLQDQEYSLNKNFNTLIDQHFKVFYQLMEQNQQSVWEYFHGIDTEIHEIYKERDQKKYLAEKAVQTAYGLCQSICEVYDHECYFPGAVEGIGQSLETAYYNLEQDMNEAALVLAQQASQQLSILRIDIEEKMQRAAFEQSFTIEKVQSLCSLIRNNEFVSAIDLNGNKLDITIDVDYWTSKGISKLLKRTEGLLGQLEANEYGIEFNDYTRIQQFILPQIEKSLQDLIADARIKVILSQIRFNIAEAVIEKLSEQGFYIEDGNYSDTDEREPYSVITQNLEGCQVKVLIESGEQPGQYALHIDSEESGEYTYTELKQRANTLLRSLQNAGLRVGTPVEVQSDGKGDRIIPSAIQRTRPQQMANAYGD